MLFCFASLPLFLQFIGEFLFMCRMFCEMQFVHVCMSKLLTVYPRITLRVGLISWIYLLYSWQVTGTRDPPESFESRAQKMNARYPKLQKINSRNETNT